MPPKGQPTSRIELLQGTLDLIILQALRWGPAHGYGLVQMIRAQSGNALHVETGSLYPALQRLLRQRMGRLGERSARAHVPPDHERSRAPRR